jgi:hypothetical protein
MLSGLRSLFAPRFFNISRLVCWWSAELTVAYYLRNPSILASDKKPIRVYESIVAVVVSSGASGVFYAIGPAAEATIAYRRRQLHYLTDRWLPGE